MEATPFVVISHDGSLFKEKKGTTLIGVLYSWFSEFILILSNQNKIKNNE